MTPQEWMDRFAAAVEPQFADIRRKLDDLITRREHEKDLTDLKGDITTVVARLDAIDRWRETRPQFVPSEDRFSALQTRMMALEARPEKTEVAVNRWLGFGFMVLFGLIGACSALSGVFSFLMALSQWLGK